MRTLVKEGGHKCRSGREDAGKKGGGFVMAVGGTPLTSTAVVKS